MSAGGWQCGREVAAAAAASKHRAGCRRLSLHWLLAAMGSLLAVSALHAAKPAGLHLRLLACPPSNQVGLTCLQCMQVWQFYAERDRTGQGGGGGRQQAGLVAGGCWHLAGLAAGLLLHLHAPCRPSQCLMSPPAFAICSLPGAEPVHASVGVLWDPPEVRQEPQVKGDDLQQGKLGGIAQLLLLPPPHALPDTAQPHCVWWMPRLVAPSLYARIVAVRRVVFSLFEHAAQPCQADLVSNVVACLPGALVLTRLPTRPAVQGVSGPC